MVPVDQPHVIDFMSIDPQRHLALTMSDHLDWSDSVAQLTILQAVLGIHRERRILLRRTQRVGLPTGPLPAQTRLGSAGIPVS